MKELEDLKYHIVSDEGLKLWETAIDKTAKNRRTYEGAISMIRGIARNINVAFPKDVVGDEY